MTPQQTALIEHGITITNIIKNCLRKKPEIVLSRIIDSMPLDNITEGVLAVGREYGITGYTVVETIYRLQTLLIVQAGTPLWKRLLNGFAVAFVKALANDGKLDLMDLPVLVESVYLELKKK